MAIVLLSRSVPRRSDSEGAGRQTRCVDMENGIRISHSFPDDANRTAAGGKSPARRLQSLFPAKLADGRRSPGAAAVGAHMTPRTWFRLTVLAIGSTLVTPLCASSLPDSYLAMPVLLDDNASGVYLQHRQSVYFVTARHVLFDGESAEPRKPRVRLRSFTKNRSIQDPIIFELDLATLAESHRILSSKADRIAAVRIGDVTRWEGHTVHWETAPGVVAKAQSGPAQIILGADEWRRLEEAKVGNDVFLASTEQLERGRPLLLEGTLAEKDRATKRLIVDARVTPENIGGPAIEVEEFGPRSLEPNFIGIVVEKLPRKPPFDDSEHAVVASVDAILDLIEKP
jgi:hypothetical protein